MQVLHQTATVINPNQPGTTLGTLMDVETNRQEAIEKLHRQAKAIREWVIPAMEDTLQTLTEQIQAIQAEMETIVAITKTVMDKR